MLARTFNDRYLFSRFSKPGFQIHIFQGLSRSSKYCMNSVLSEIIINNFSSSGVEVNMDGYYFTEPVTHNSMKVTYVSVYLQTSQPFCKLSETPHIQTEKYLPHAIL